MSVIHRKNVNRSGENMSVGESVIHKKPSPSKNRSLACVRF